MIQFNVSYVSVVVRAHYLMKTKTHVCICETDLWGPQLCPLLECLSAIYIGAISFLQYLL